MADHSKRGAPSGSAFGGCIAWMNKRSTNWPLAEMLRPIHERNEYDASEKREIQREGKRENRGVTEILRLAPFVFVNPFLFGFHIVSCGTAVELYNWSALKRFRLEAHVTSFQNEKVRFQVFGANFWKLEENLGRSKRYPARGQLNRENEYFLDPVRV